jgi:hypothetical protein
VDRKLLESVLRETLATERCDEPLEPRQREALRQIAQQHRGEPLTLEPVGVQLVDAILRSEVPVLAMAPETWRAMTAQIAATFFEDPGLRARIELLWNHLSEGPP